MANIPPEDLKKLPEFTAALAAQLKENAVKVDESVLNKAILTAFDKMGGAMKDCDQCANGWRW